MTVLLLATLLAGSFDVTGQMSGVYPVAGLDRFHASSAMLGVGLGYSLGNARLELGYRYTNLPGVQSSPYRLTLHQAALSGSYPLVRWNTWGIEALLGGGCVFGQRTYGAGRENGRTGSGEVGVEVFQKAGKSRLTIGLVHLLLFEQGGAGSPGVSVQQLFSFRAGVGYVF